MYCVVISKLKGIYLLRHIIYDIEEKENIEKIKKNYYNDYCETDTDEFYLCHNKSEMKNLLSKYNIKM